MPLSYRFRVLIIGLSLSMFVIVAVLSDMVSEEGSSMIEQITIIPKRAGYEYEVVGLQTLHTVHTKGLHHRGVWVYVTDENGYMLVVWRPAHMRTCASAWCIIGEHSIPQESWTDTAKRGMREELGWSRSDVLSVSAVGSLYFNHTYANGKRDSQLCTIFHVVVKGGKRRPVVKESFEIGRSRWIKPRNLVKEASNSTDDSKYCDTYTKGMVFGHGLAAVCKHMNCNLTKPIPYSPILVSLQNSNWMYTNKDFHPKSGR